MFVAENAKGKSIHEIKAFTGLPRTLLFNARCGRRRPEHDNKQVAGEGDKKHRQN